MLLQLLIINCYYKQKHTVSSQTWELAGSELDWVVTCSCFFQLASQYLVDPKGLKSSLSLPTLLVLSSYMKMSWSLSHPMFSPALLSPSSLELSTAESLPPGLKEWWLSDKKGSLSSSNTVAWGHGAARFLLWQVRGSVGSLLRRLQSMLASAETGARKCLWMSVFRTPLCSITRISVKDTHSDMYIQI